MHLIGKFGYACVQSWVVLPFCPSSFCVCSPSPLNSRLQARCISPPKNKPTQSISLARPTSTDTLRHPIRIASYCDPARHGDTCTLRFSPAKHSRPRAASSASVCNHHNCTHVLHAYRSGFDQYRMVELHLCSGSFTPFLSFTYSPGENKHIAVRGNEV
jgi:hypothetical protein